MRSIIYFTRCINSMTTRINADTCSLASTTLKPSFVARRVHRLLLSRVHSSHTGMQHDTDVTKIEWDPIQIFNCPANYKYAVVILNRPIYWRHDLFLRIWEKAQVTVTVDGGTHRWIKYLEEKGIDILSREHACYVPDLITGDMDSCSPLLINKLQSISSMVVKTPDQAHTDYTKALLKLGEYVKMKDINLNGIYVFAETSGRLDHIVGNINTLYKSEKLVGNIPVVQVASNSLTWLLKPGFHSIAIPETLVQNNTWCGLLPFGSPVNHITTTGLKWNMNDSRMQFGGLISSSNTYDNCVEVTVNTDTTVIWTMGIEPLLENMSDCTL